MKKIQSIPLVIFFVLFYFSPQLCSIFVLCFHLSFILSSIFFFSMFLVWVILISRWNCFCCTDMLSDTVKCGKCDLWLYQQTVSPKNNIIENYGFLWKGSFQLSIVLCLCIPLLYLKYVFKQAFKLFKVSVDKIHFPVL